MNFVHKVEKALDGPMSALPSLPNESKKGLAKVWPWLALAAAVLQLLTAFRLYQWAYIVNNYVDWANSTNVKVESVGFSTGFTFWVWAAITILIIDALILFLAIPKLQKKLKAGWDLLLLAAIINLIFGVSSLFIDGLVGVMGLLSSIIGSAIGFYLLFQVREYFAKKEVKTKK